MGTVWALESRLTGRYHIIKRLCEDVCIWVYIYIYVFIALHVNHVGIGGHCKGNHLVPQQLSECPCNKNLISHMYAGKPILRIQPSTSSGKGFGESAVQSYAVPGFVVLKICEQRTLPSIPVRFEGRQKRNVPKNIFSKVAFCCPGETKEPRGTAPVCFHCLLKT